MCIIVRLRFLRIHYPSTNLCRKGGSLNTNSVYTVTENDEVEDLYNLLRDIQKEKGEAFFTAVCSGAILSDYQRVRVESV